MPDRLDASSRQELLARARGAIERRLGLPRESSPPPARKELLECVGAFVTLHKKDALRGCIGIFESPKPLYQTVQEMAQASAFEDPRFPPVRKDELQHLDVEISVLSPLRRIQDPSEIDVGTHGIYIIKGYNRGVLLPQVAVDQGWDRDTFLGHTCMKAGLSPDAWKGDVEIHVFTAEVFGEKHVTP